MKPAREGRRHSEEEIAEAVRLVNTEHPGKRLLMNVTLGHREMALRQSAATMALGCLTMASLYFVGDSSERADHASIDTWARWTVANIAIRALLMWYMFYPQRPADVARSIYRRLSPLVVAALAAIQWVWTIHVFVAETATATAFLAFAGLLATSVSVMSMWPTSPIATVVYVSITWATFFKQLAVNVGAPPIEVVTLFLSVCILLWACAYLQAFQIRTILDRSDKVNLLFSDLHKANAELTEANATLARMRTDAATELEVRSMFFSGASHDFRQRLHAMKLLANTTLRHAMQEERETAALKRLTHAVEEVERYVNDVLDFARADAKATKPHLEVVSLQALFQNLDIGFEDVSAERGVTLLFRTTTAQILTDAAMLQRILENLISNAIKFSSG